LTVAAEKWGEWIPPPSAIAGKVRGKIPLFIGARYLKPVAYRAKCQINENSKMMAFSLEVPEATHNEIEGFQSRKQDSILPVFLRQEGEALQEEQQLNALVDLCNELNLSPVSLKASGSTTVEKMLTLTQYLDMLSVDLAELQGVNALSVERITELKKRMASRN
jgi:glucose/mannose-6-phosphate isomerase